ncbi:hypothetical protein ACFWOJ_35615 [Streptomyces sp. NPDC058439]
MKDYQAKQMLELIRGGYDPELLWCDIGGPNDSLNVRPVRRPSGA